METPKITLSEALAVGGAVVTVLPHDPVVAFTLLPIGAGIWGLRRYSGFRSWVAAQREALEKQEFVGRELLCYALERLPVPPVGVKGLAGGRSGRGAPAAGARRAPQGHSLTPE